MAEVPLFVPDSNSVLRWLLPNREFSTQATSMAEDFTAGHINLMAPYLFDAEVGGGVRKAVANHHITYELGRQRFQVFLALAIPLAQVNGLNSRAFENCQRFSISFLDALYVTVAEEYRASLITADIRLINALSRFPYKMFLADYQSPMSGV